MTRPAVPSRFQKEGPASPCVLAGQNLTWKNCTVLSAAMGMDKSTIGRVKMSGCAVRDETNDHAGGTTLTQVQAVCSAHGVKTEAHTGGNVAGFYYLAYQAGLGRGFILQGNTYPDGRGNVNHAVWVNSPVGGKLGDPDGFDVWDPWSNGPEYWSYSRTVAFARALHPYGESDPRTLKNMGINGAYALLFPDTEPHVHLKYGGTRSSPFPDRTRVTGRQWSYKSPMTGEANRVKLYDTGDLYVAYQYTVRSGRKWAGSHAGTQWIPTSALAHMGGTT
jgi:hypothetical protein